MSTWFITRHPGAIAWAMRQGLAADRQLAHLDPAQLAPGDPVIGPLPGNLIARVCARGGRYRHPPRDLPAQARGRELTVDVLGRFGARLEAYVVTPTP